jgi:biotin operon repressor
MHSGNLATSERLISTLAAIQDGNWHSTLAIMLKTHSVAVHSDISALRAEGNDIAIETRQIGKVHEYRLSAGAVTANDAHVIATSEDAKDVPAPDFSPVVQTFQYKDGDQTEMAL